jgi:hypothetical protein
MDLTVDPLPETLDRNAQAAFELGFLGRNKPDITGLVEGNLLAEAQRGSAP